MVRHGCNTGTGASRQRTDMERQLYKALSLDKIRTQQVKTCVHSEVRAEQKRAVKSLNTMKSVSLKYVLTPELLPVATAGTRHGCITPTQRTPFYLGLLGCLSNEGWESSAVGMGSLPLGRL
jgi:hypothetical protein